VNLLASLFRADIIPSVIVMAVPLILGSMGALINEKSGVLNIGVEGMMLSSAFVATVVAYFSNNPWLGMLMGTLTGMAFGFLLAFIAVTLKGDQTLAGLSINMFAAGFSGFMLQVIFKHGGQSPSVPTLPKFSFDSGVFHYLLDGQNVLSIIAFIIPLVIWIALNWSKWGNWITAVGEDPLVAETAGISVTKVRYTATIISGALSGLAGVFLTLGPLGMFVENMTAGRGFIALAALILGRWNPLLTLISSLFLGYTMAVQMKLQIIGILHIPREVFLMLPYLLTIIVLIFSVGNFKGPSSVAKPYIKERK